MRYSIAYCPTCRSTRTLSGRKTWRKPSQNSKRLYTRIYHCESCSHFVFSERLPIQKQIKKEIHYGFGAYRT